MKRSTIVRKNPADQAYQKVILPEYDNYYETKLPDDYGEIRTAVDWRKLKKAVCIGILGITLLVIYALLS